MDGGSGAEAPHLLKNPCKKWSAQTPCGWHCSHCSYFNVGFREDLAFSLDQTLDAAGAPGYIRERPGGQGCGLEKNKT
eukprot:2704295-Amphidinium_carterae.1